MVIKINGKPEEIDGDTLGNLIRSKKIEPQMVSIELNNKMVNRADLDTITLSEGDAIELLYFMGGGSSHPRIIKTR
ncbi:MAG: sulfur carrier protein ThiS [Nitrospiria bacterium]